LLEKIEYNDILRQVFNAKSSGKIEVLKIPGNKNEIIFKLQTSEKPFGLIKIGDISGWLKEKLEGYEIIESFENESIFKKINHDDSEINILMGSRSFYEGWDSNRPNIILFVNIGVGSDAKKFVLQAIGRGVRIEPQKNKRKRILSLYNAKEIKKELFNKVRENILPLESLFVFGTNAENLKEIIATLQAEKQDKNLGEAFILNPEAKKHTLLVPVYKITEKIFAEKSNPQKHPISREDFDISSKFCKFLDDKVTVAKYDCEVMVLKKVKESFDKEKDKYYDFSEKNSLFEPELILARIFDYLGVKSREFDKFKKLENEIVHFKKVRFTGREQYEKILEGIKKVEDYPKKESQLQQLKLEFEKHKDIDKYTREVQDIENQYVKESVYEYNAKRIKIKYLANHYYLPLIVSETEKIDYINHIVNVDSEVKFIGQLESYLQDKNNIFKEFDWWMFSKLDQTLDEVYIPYYNPKENNMARFKPDFIFWMQKGNEYVILFVDPKGTEHADGYRKIDGYSRIFETKERKESKAYPFNGFNIKTKLLLKPKRGIAETLENYRKYWFDNFGDFATKLNN